jgi:hypothetical protein
MVGHRADMGKVLVAQTTIENGIIALQSPLRVRSRRAADS